MLATAAAIYGVGASSAFEYTTLRIDGATLTEPSLVEGAFAEARGSNLFRLSTAPFGDRILEFPTVREVSVGIELPNTLAVRLVEREPILVWRVGARSFLADESGLLFAELAGDGTVDPAGLPVIEDSRDGSERLTVRSSLDPVDLDAARRLGSLVPADVGSVSESLRVTVSDANGFVVRAIPGGWTAIFGFYTATLRTTSIVPGQVRLLRSLLAGREAEVDRVILADEDDGTYLPRSTSSPKP